MLANRYAPIRTLTSLSLVLVALGCSKPEITGTATLPDCNESPAAELSGTWFDQGTVTITGTGCESSDAPVGTTFRSCPLNWKFSQNGNSVAIRVDDEYDIQGRVCGSTLHLEGGWWLPVADDNDHCNYDDDDGDEVGIDEGGSSLELEDGTLVGTLLARGQCKVSYQTRLTRL